MSSFEVGADMPTEITIAQLSRLIGLPGAPVLAMCAQSQRVIGFHLPFPGTGLVERGGLSYRFVPA